MRFLLTAFLVALLAGACGGGGSSATGSDPTDDSGQGATDNGNGNSTGDTTGGGNTDGGTSGDSGTFPQTAVSAYDPAAVPPVVAPAPNLISNGSFESDSEPWDLCGTGTIITDPASASDGQRFLRFNNSATCDQAGGLTFQTSNGWAYRPVSLPQPLPERLYFSMRVRSTTRLDGVSHPFEVRLVGNLNRQSIFDIAEATFPNYSTEEIDSSWTIFKTSIDRDLVEAYLNGQQAGWLLIEALTPSPLEQLDIDDMRLTSEPNHQQAAPMPDALVSQAADNRLVMMDTSANRLVTMRGDGSSLHRYDSLDTSSLVTYPAFADSDNLLLAQRRFDPLVPGDATVLAAAGTNTTMLNFPSLASTLIHEDIGAAGVYVYDGHPSNRMAVDITVRSLSWDSRNNRGVFGTCAQNRTFGFVSDDVCQLRVVDGAGNSTLTDIDASSAAFAPDGSRIAYLETSGKKIFWGTLDGNTVNAELAYESAGRLLNTLRFSPDGTKLLIGASTAAQYDLANGSIRRPYAIKELDLASGSANHLLLVDHGDLYADFAYASDPRFIYYTVSIGGENQPQVWWFDRSSEQTGPLTTQFNASGVTRRPG